MPDLNAATAEILNSQLQEQSEADNAFAAANAALQSKVKEAQQQLLSKVFGKSPQQTYSPEVLAIANALTASPRLVPLVDAYLKKLVAAVNSAVDQALSEASK